MRSLVLLPVGPSPALRLSNVRISTGYSHRGFPRQVWSSGKPRGVIPYAQGRASLVGKDVQPLQSV